MRCIETLTSSVHSYIVVDHLLDHDEHPVSTAVYCLKGLGLRYTECNTADVKMNGNQQFLSLWDRYDRDVLQADINFRLYVVWHIPRHEVG